MASSSEIKAQIDKKEKEIKELKELKQKVKKLDDELSCVHSKFKAAGGLIVEAGDIGGVPFDSGKTAQVADELKAISDDVGINIEDIDKRISDLQDDVDKLKVDYSNALEAEKRAANNSTDSDSDSESESET